MLNLIRNIIEEYQGIDSEAANEIRKEKLLIARSVRYIFSQKIRMLLLSFCGLYIMFTIFYTIGTWDILSPNFIIWLIRNIVGLIISSFIAICIFIKTKKSEILAIVGIIIFFVSLYTLYLI